MYFSLSSFHLVCSSYVRCSQYDVLPSCDNVCGKKLNCLMHRCTNICHEGNDMSLFDDHMIVMLAFMLFCMKLLVQASSIEFSSKFEVTLEGGIFSFFLTWSCDVPAVT